MKAFEVFYDIGGSSGNRVIVLAKDDEDIEKSLAEKTEYEMKDRFSRIRRITEVPLSRVKLSELSVTEFFMLQGGM